MTKLHVEDGPVVLVLVEVFLLHLLLKSHILPTFAEHAHLQIQPASLLHSMSKEQSRGGYHGVLFHSRVGNKVHAVFVL
jgi:hypothetical protein